MCDFSSQLSSLNSEPSTSESILTAKAEHSCLFNRDATPSSFESKKGSLSQPLIPRDARCLPMELRQHVQIQLEDRCYTTAIRNLDRLLNIGVVPVFDEPDMPDMEEGSRRQVSKPIRRLPAWVAPPSHLAMLATLAIHPVFTTRPDKEDPEGSQVPAPALQYLRDVLVNVGAVKADFCEAFVFKPRRIVRKSYKSGADVVALGIGGPVEPINHKLAGDQGLWRRADNLWAVLGWVFRCAQELPLRWEHWKVWMEFMLDVLEADWQERLEVDMKLESGPTHKDEHLFHQDWCRYACARQSLIVRYTQAPTEIRRHALRDIARALFAFSKPENLDSDAAVFAEIFPKEGEQPVKNKNKRKRALAFDVKDKLDIPDVFEDDEEDVASSEDEAQGDALSMSGPEREKGRPNKDPTYAGVFSMEKAAETVQIRMRIFRLLSDETNYIRDFPFAVNELYDKMVEHVRSSPLPLFRLYVQWRDTPLPSDAYIHLIGALLGNMVTKRGAIWEHDPANADQNLSIGMLEKRHLPFAANRVFAEDNAKLSILLEMALEHLYRQLNPESGQRGFPYTLRFREAIEEGIEARDTKVRGRKSSYTKNDPAEEAAREALDRSARNLIFFVDCLEMGVLSGSKKTRAAG